MSIDTTNKFGFYDENTRQFYVIPATSEQEFKKFMEMIGMANSANKNNQQTNQHMIPESPTVELFDDFDSVVEEVARAPDNLFSSKLIYFDN